MTKALMRMRRRTTLPTTDTSNTVELAPSPMMGAGTAREGGRGGKRQKSIVNITAQEEASVHSVIVSLSHSSSPSLSSSPLPTHTTNNVCSRSPSILRLPCKVYNCFASLQDNENPLGPLFDLSLSCAAVSICITRGHLV